MLREMLGTAEAGLCSRLHGLSGSGATVAGVALGDFTAMTASMLGLLHVSLNRLRFTDKNMQPFIVLQRPLRVQ